MNEGLSDGGVGRQEFHPFPEPFFVRFLALEEAA